MRDAAAIEEAGVPTITLVHDVFERAAKLQAEVAGRPDLPMVIFPQGKPEPSEEEVDRQAHHALERIVALLSST